MLNKFYVLVLSLNKSGGNSEEIIRKDDYNSAERTYYDKCSSYAGNAQTGFVVIKLLHLMNVKRVKALYIKRV